MIAACTTNSGVCAAGVASADRCTVSPAKPHQGSMEQVWRDGMGSFRFNAPDEFLPRNLPALRSGE